MKIEVELTGFTPVLDDLIREYDLVTAAIYGIVWRYAQMSDKVCKASLKRIGGRLDLSGKTAERHIKKLCDDGYLVDLAPDLRNKPHTYAVTGKAELAGTIAAHSDRESYQGQTESPTRSDRESYQGQTESPLKIHSKKDNKDILENSQSPKLTQSEKDDLNTLAAHIAKAANINTNDEEAKPRIKAATLLGYKIAQACALIISIIAEADPRSMASLVKVAISLYQNNVTPDNLKDFNVWWYANTWQGRDKGQPPTPSLIASTWGQFEADQVAPANGAPSTGPVLTEAQKKRLAELVAENGG